MRRLPQGICNASAEPQRWASQRERGIDWPHWLAAWEIGQEQVIECRLAKGPEVTFKKQIWGETAHGTTHHPLLPLIHMQPDPPPHRCSGILWLLCINCVPNCGTYYFALSCLHARPQGHLTGSSLISKGVLQSVVSCESREQQRDRQTGTKTDERETCWSVNSVKDRKP